MSDLVHNERTKLTANVLNAAASGMFITGVVAPAVAVIYGVTGPAQVATLLIALSSLAWMSAAIAIHALARYVLGSLR